MPDLIRNPSPARVIELALKHEGKTSSLTSTGALSCMSGAKTGRSPKDKRIVDNPESHDDVWWGPVNIPLSTQSFMINRERAVDYLRSRARLFIVDAFAGHDPEYRVRIRIICSRAYHALFMSNMLIPATPEELKDFVPDFVIYNAGTFPANRYVDGMTSACSVDLNLERAEMVILGTQYAGEMKKGVLTLMMHLMTKRGQLCLHSSANEDPRTGDTTLFFGLSGTGKTTLSADPRRLLIGDDEHVWTEKGIFNIEGGCYAKCIGLTEEKEPEIFNAVRYGAVVENVVMDNETRTVDFDDTSITENTRCAYPLHFIPNAKKKAVGGHPTNVILLTCDATGVLPLVSKLTREQVIYHFVSGFTSKMVGTEEGVTEPVATFSSCYGEPFLMWHPLKYAEMLADKLEHHQAHAFLLNTGWIGSSGQRCPLKYTRAIVDAIHSGELAKADYARDATFGLLFPTSCPGVPSALLNPAANWDDAAAFGRAQAKLAAAFNENFVKKGFSSAVSADVLAQAPRIGGDAAAVGKQSAAEADAAVGTRRATGGQAA
mmetsp:Transcript_17633/g.51216  ORF Transcript_17633/g.51216 Transcript_17633/m.51216 type:complete len:546 (+) Transcript_17633:1-1638(+)